MDSCTSKILKNIGNDFAAEQNHDLYLVEQLTCWHAKEKCLKMQVYENDIVDDLGIKQNTSYELLGKQFSGRANVDYMFRSKNYLRRRRLRNLMCGEWRDK